MHTRFGGIAAFARRKFAGNGAIMLTPGNGKAA